ncbi:MAG: hypothetical protein WCO49_19085 [Nostocales cyanobacterium ELA608]
MDEKVEKPAAVDIISIDSKIISYFDIEKEKVVNYKTRIKELSDIVLSIKDPNNINKIREDIAIYEQKISEFENNNNCAFYLLETLPIIEKYKQNLDTPIKINFSGRNKAAPAVDNSGMINEYLQIAIKYIAEFDDFDIGALQKDHRQACEACGSKKIFLDNLFIICEECGHEKEAYQKISLEFVKPVNQKYIDERKAHFRDCMNQFQGKQNSRIDGKVFKNLENEFVKRNILIGGDDTPRKERYRNVKFEHIMTFLKELGLDKHYDNAKYIYSVMTGATCPDLSKIEDQILNDFDTLINLYIKKYKYEGKLERKSFLSVQYLLMAILKKNKFPCEKEDFINILKTNDRKAFHDDIARVLFSELSWNFTPLF